MIMRAALELFHNRNHAGVVAVCQGALADDPGNVHLRILLARALLALRQDADAQHELSLCLEHSPRCPDAYRLLGELALRRDELKSAEIFARESLRLDPSNDASRELLEIVRSLVRPTAAVEKLPAATVAVGHPSPPSVPPSPSSSRPSPPGRGRIAAGTSSDDAAPQRARRVPRFGEYLLHIGALTPPQLRAALAYHRSSGVRLGAAAAALGLISQPKVEWAAHAFHGSRRR